MHDLNDPSTPRFWLWSALPLVLVGVALALFFSFDPMSALTGDQPPVQNLSIERVELDDDGFTVDVVNAAPEPVTISQVQVDEAYWSFDIRPDSTLGRLEEATVQIPYPWVHGELHEIRLLTDVGMTFSHTVEVATATPQPTPTRWGLFALLGAFIGVIPVGLGLLWFPVLQSLTTRTMNFVLALTLGLLIFLFFDTLLEGIEIAEHVPGVFQALPLVFLVGLMSYLVLTAAGRWGGRTDRSTASGRSWIATAIALGIGLHNLGEGMAVGAAIAAGEAALGSFLVVGFVLHNLTEGIGIGAPMADDDPGWPRLGWLTLLGGGPAILGTWMGGFHYSPFWAALFFAVGAGAILQVIVEVGRLLVDRADDTEMVFTSWVNLGGVTAGLAIMYATALLV